MSDSSDSSVEFYTSVSQPSFLFEVTRVTNRGSLPFTPTCKPVCCIVMLVPLVDPCIQTENLCLNILIAKMDVRVACAVSASYSTQYDGSMRTFRLFPFVCGHVIALC